MTILIILKPNCGKKTEQDIINDFIKNVGEQAEKKDITNLLSFLADDFYDMMARSRNEIEKVLSKYFQYYRAIVFHLLSTKIIKISLPDAEIETEISLSSGPAKIFRKIVPYTGQIYRFRIKLRKIKDIWYIAYAEWQYITIEELFPESFKLLRKIFPNI